MGSTGHSLYRKGSDVTDTETFGIIGAVRYKGKIPENSGLDKPSNSKITLKVQASDGSHILFQFKLSKDNKAMTIIGYKNSVPEVKCKVAVDSGQPSLDKVLATTNSVKVKNQVVKMKDLFAKSTEIKENQLGSIANSLLMKKKAREGDK